jgi:hypothetical protein
MNRGLRETLVVMDAARSGPLFLAGVFFGGAVDHAILALRRADHTPYGFKAGVVGNWAFAALDAAAAAALYAAHRRAARARSEPWPRAARDDG